jgi:hypothetical protein
MVDFGRRYSEIGTFYMMGVIECVHKLNSRMCYTAELGVILFCTARARPRCARSRTHATVMATVVPYYYSCSSTATKFSILNLVQNIDRLEYNRSLLVRRYQSAETDLLNLVLNLVP